MPRFLIAAAHKSSGKTVVTTGLAAALTGRGRSVQTFKKGPDYIDPMWLAAASGRPCYNLDFNLMTADQVGAFYATQAKNGDLGLIETNKGLYDGVALDGTDSNAALAKLLNMPVVLVVDTVGMTRGIAPLLLGYRAFDHDVEIGGVILNKVGGPRHEAKLRAAIEAFTDIPVLGAVWKTPELEIGERHLGLTTPAETGGMTQKIADFARIMAGSVDLDRLEKLADVANPLPFSPTARRPSPATDIRVAIARDRAFGFYYPDDLEAFAQAGAALVPFDTLADDRLPANIDALFIGGGFPETQMEALAANTALHTHIRAAIKGGLPTYAECGGLMYLCKTLEWRARRLPMVGVVPGDAVMNVKPQGRGYAVFTNTSRHLWPGAAPQTAAHEFHYASISGLAPDTKFARQIKRGTGIDGQHDALVSNNMIAGFCHLRDTPNTPWVADFVNFARARKRAP